MLFRVELIVFFSPVFRCAPLLESEILSTKSPSVAGSLAFLGAMEPHGRGADKQLAPPARKFAVAGDRDMDANPLRGLI